MHNRLTNIALVLALIALPVFADTGSATSDAPLTLWTIHQHPNFYAVMLASMVGWILGITKGFSSSRDWLGNYVENSHWLVVFVLDAVLFVLVGAYIGTGIYEPTSIVAALGAGITWPVALGALASPPPEDQGPPSQGGGQNA